jgi:hypothetical protein
MPTLSPLTHFFTALSDWSSTWEFECANEFGTSDTLSLFERFRQGAAELTLWLTMQGHDSSADAIDTALAELRQTLWEFDQGKLKGELSPRETDDPLAPEELVTAAIEKAAGHLEDIDCELPEEVWKGFEDA